MAGFEVYVDALEDCAGKAMSVSNLFKADADEAPVHVGQLSFGTLENTSGKLVAAVGKLQAKIRSETRHAQQNLAEVETAVHTVIGNVKSANSPGSGVVQA
ncbi:hypothetical protein IMZ11_02055 [Microtetraspora sp. AC03309]|uniref:hypothetical protein n=1 Tax=Microtetraspora sp. AC03309 TaxID=2779376 RepID=UPI001E3D9D01|nr:hypothetical protein [Microtetraspora sp. AC03309]MCC5574423.1 hypothetical protein [Microtetraspora sp. AC03309]